MYSISAEELHALQDEERRHDDDWRHDDRLLNLTLLDRWWSSLDLLPLLERSVIVPHFE